MDCYFQHPKICFKWQRNGSDKGGCKKENCSFLHPRLCIQSVRSRNCTKTKCNFFHLRGTHFTEGTDRRGLSTDYRDAVRAPHATSSRGHSEYQQTRKNPGSQGQINPVAVNSSQKSNFIKGCSTMQYQSSEENDDLRRDFLEFKMDIMKILEKLTPTAKQEPPIRTVLQRPQSMNCCSSCLNNC